MQIPVTFNHNGKESHGVFTAVKGAGMEIGTLYHLTVNNFYIGQLFLVEDPQQERDLQNLKYKWRFRSQKGEIDYLEDYFIDVLIAWYE